MDLDARIKELMAFKTRIEGMIAASNPNDTEKSSVLHRLEEVAELVTSMQQDAEADRARIEALETLQKADRARVEAIEGMVQGRVQLLETEVHKRLEDAEADRGRIQHLETELHTIRTALHAAAEAAAEAADEKRGVDVAPKGEEAPAAPSSPKGEEAPAAPSQADEAPVKAAT